MDKRRQSVVRSSRGVVCELTALANARLQEAQARINELQGAKDQDQRFILSPAQADEIEKFNAEIKKMQADGTYNIILRLDWIRADVDGDGRTELVAGNTRDCAGPRTGT